MLALLCVGTGMRWGEAAALHWQDVHEKTVRIRHAYSWRGGYVKAYPKDGRERTVPLAPWLAAELDAWRPAKVAIRCTTPHKLGRCRSGLVLPREGDGCLPYTTCNHAFQYGVRLAGIGHTTIHDLRDTYASWLLQAGVSIEQIAEFLGHSDINLTRARYAQFGSSQFDRVAAAMPAPAGTIEPPAVDESADSAESVAPILPQYPEGNIIDLTSRRRSRTI
jgi:integrase